MNPVKFDINISKKGTQNSFNGMKIGIILVSFNKNNLTIDCLDSLSKIELGKHIVEVFVVDNGSNPKLEVDEKNYKNITVSLIRNNENLGFAEGVNTGIKQALNAERDYVLILNNDTTHDSGFLLNLIKATNSPSAGIVSPKIYFSKGREFHKDRYRESDLGKVIWYAGGILNWENVLASHRGVDEVDRGQFDKTTDSDFATGCCMLVKKEVFEKIGLFDPKYFLYLEDLDFSVRAKKAGFKIVFESSSLIWHYNAASTGGSGGDLHDYFIARNRMLFGKKYAGFRAKLALTRESLMLLLSGRKWQRQGIKDYYLGRMHRGSFPA